MREKQEFYDQYGVEEYYEYDPRSNRLSGFRRQGEVWLRIRRFTDWISPRLGVHFDVSGEELTITTVNGERFFSFEEAAQRWQDAQKLASQEKQRADQEKQRADQAEIRSQRLVELIRKWRQSEATAEELEELDRLQ